MTNFKTEAAAIYEQVRKEMTLAYLEKCRKYFDFAKMYSVEPAIVFPKPLERPVEMYR